MKILVCIKPDMDGQDIGPFESLALEAALRLKDNEAAYSVDVITAGPESWADCIRRALGMGADNGIHVCTEPGPDQEQELYPGQGMAGLVPAGITAQRLARALAHPQVNRTYDLILTGVMSQDLMAGQTGPMLAAYLDIALATAVVSIRSKDGQIIGVREWEGGIKETFEADLPALLAVQAGEYAPRYPGLSNMLKARSAKILTLADQQLDPNTLQPGEIFMETAVPEKSRAGQRVAGTVDQQVTAFNLFLRERGLL